MVRSALDLFDPVTRAWFTDTLGEPTDVQELAWRRIAAGDHVLATAPTGSGKTLTAFLWAIDQLLTGKWPGGAVRVLYISPVKALGNDIQRNLLGPLSELTDRAARATGREPPDIRVRIRSGDTPQNERRKMLKDPPEILITTPESLNLLLTSPNGRRMLGDLETVIVDEVHSVMGSKRGVHLITAVERLTALSGEVQRIGLSATIRPLERVARWLGGRVFTGSSHRDRAVAIVSSAMSKNYELEIGSNLHDGDGEPRDREAFWLALATDLRRRIRHSGSTLVFANSRRTVERVAHLINEGQSERLTWSHHGALSREIRQVVERRLKDGELRAIVATNSLELGIDVGAIDEVVLVQAPPSVASTIQRLGRSGHRVGETSRGRMMPLHPRDLLQCAVAGAAALAGDLEEIHPVENALDVLAQVVLSMTVGQAVGVDDLFDAIRCADPYRRLPRPHFDLVVEMLAGRFASSRVRSLRPLASLDRVDGTLRSRPGSDRLLYLSGGTIPDRGYYRLRLDGSSAPLGELDEEFVWERSVGDTFSLGVQSWRVERITHSDVFVSPAKHGAAMAPFWRAEERDGSLHLAGRVAETLERIEPLLMKEDLSEAVEGLPVTEPAAKQLLAFLAEQYAATGCLPHRHRVVVEHCPPSRGRAGEQQVILHTLWGGRVNRPLALAIQAAWKAQLGIRPTAIHDDDCVILSAPEEAFANDPLDLIAPGALTDLLREGLGATGYFGARFREAAGVALLLPRAGFNRRTPLWLHRQRAKELLDSVRDTQDFPLVLEAWRSCLQDGFDIEGLRRRLDAVRDGRIEVRHVRTDHPSPLAAHVLWKQTNELMYEDDRPAGDRGAGARADLIGELALASHLRPEIDPALVTELQAKLNRTAPGYAPAPGRDLVDWAVERLVLTATEWTSIITAVAHDHDQPEADVLAGVADRIVAIGGPPSSLVVAVENLQRVGAALDRDLASMAIQIVPGAATAKSILAPIVVADDPGALPFTLPELIAERLRFRGPVHSHIVANDLGIEHSAADRAITLLADEHTVVVDRITAGAEDVEICDRENLERLLRMVRAASRPRFEPRPVEELPLFLAHHQGLGGTDGRIEDLQDRIEALLGWPAPAAAWETFILPARMDSYHPEWLDTLLVETELRWVGCGKAKLTFILADDNALLSAEETAESASIEDLFPHRLGRFGLDELQRHTQRSSSDLTALLWRAAWAGQVSTDTFATVRRAAEHGFKTPRPTPLSRGRRRLRRGELERWRAGRPFEGHWFALPEPPATGDALDRDEEDRDRARLLLDRYGIVFRRLLERELPALRWSSIFRSLRLMELAGEVVSGRFFEGVNGLQFMDHRAWRQLERGLPEDRLWWLCATDPASPCGLGLDTFPARLPRRAAPNLLVFHGRQLVVTAEASGRKLRIEPRPDHPLLADYLGFLATMLGRRVQPMRHVDVESINDAPAAESPYRAAFEKRFHITRHGDGLRVSRRF